MYRWNYEFEEALVHYSRKRKKRTPVEYRQSNLPNDCTGKNNYDVLPSTSTGYVPVEPLKYIMFIAFFSSLSAGIYFPGFYY
jgi:hypothetical protein